jgi:hypothetical protein
MKVRHKFGPGDNKCEPCAVNEIDADAYAMVSGEPWCEECHDERAVVCDECDALIDGEDEFLHPESRAIICYDCAHPVK